MCGGLVVRRGKLYRSDNVTEFFRILKLVSTSFSKSSSSILKTFTVYNALK
jgi:hypothetical protein